MHVEVQDRYAELSESKIPFDEPLVIHRRTKTRENNCLIIFIHGLGGSRYGKKSTWGYFPQFVFDDFQNVDVALYQYRTAWRRLRLWASIDLRDEGRVLADILRDIDYTKIILIAHSMGGLLSKAAIKSLIDRNETASLARIVGLFLMATPQTGSQRVPMWLSWLSRDLRALKAHGELVTLITETFQDRISPECPVRNLAGCDISRLKNSRSHQTRRSLASTSLNVPIGTNRSKRLERA